MKRDQKITVILMIVFGILGILSGMFQCGRFCLGEIIKYSAGNEVSCTIFDVDKFGDEKTYWGLYTDENGEQMSAKVYNVIEAHVGETLTGYVFSGRPNKVYLKTPAWLAVISIAYGMIYIIVGAALIFLSFVARRSYTILEREGIFASGRVTSTRTRAMGGKMIYYARIKYTADDGSEQSFEDKSELDDRRVGDTVNLVYARKRNGKYTAEVK